MHKHLVKPLRNYFKLKFEKAFPKYRPCKRPLSKSTITYASTEFENCTVFAALIISPNDDVFTIECAGTTGNAYPQGYLNAAWPPPKNFRKHFFSGVGKGAAFDRFCMRLGEHVPPFREQWRRVTSFKMPEIGDLEGLRAYIMQLDREAAIPADMLEDSVDAAIEQFRKEVVPYFEKYSQAISRFEVLEVPDGPRG